MPTLIRDYGRHDGNRNLSLGGDHSVRLRCTLAVASVAHTLLSCESMPLEHGDYREQSARPLILCDQPVSLPLYWEGVGGIEREAYDSDLTRIVSASGG